MSFAVALHVMGADACVARRGGRLVVVRGGRVEHSAPLVRVASLVLHGTVGITTPALHALLDAEVPVVLLRRDGRALGRLEPPASSHADRRRRQLEASADRVRCLELARLIVSGKLANQRALLLRQRRRDEPVRMASERLGALAARALRAPDLPGLLGLEGAGGRAYFSALSAMLPEWCNFLGRDRRGGDLFNAGVNYVSALLRERVVSALAAEGLDPCLSHLHVPTRGRPTLAFDLMENFRPVLVEGSVLALLRLGVLGPGDLVFHPEGGRLSDEARRSLVRRFHARLAAPPSTAMPHPRPSTYGQALEDQVHRYVAWLCGRGDYRAFSWR